MIVNYYNLIVSYTCCYWKISHLTSEDFYVYLDDLGVKIFLQNGSGSVIIS